MHMLKFLSFLFLGLYLLVIGLNGLGFPLTFVHPGVLGFLAAVAGVLLLVRGVKGYYCSCKSCDRHDKYDNKYDNK